MTYFLSPFLVYVNNLFPHIARPWNSLPAGLQINNFKSRVYRQLLFWGSFWSTFLYGFYLCLLIFLVTPGFEAVVQPCMEWIPIKIKCYFYLYIIYTVFDESLINIWNWSYRWLATVATPLNLFRNHYYTS